MKTVLRMTLLCSICVLCTCARTLGNDAAVDSVLGQTSEKYREHGFKGVVLGQTFEQMSKERRLLPSDMDTRSMFVDANAPSNRFVFDDTGACVCYIKSLNGGEDEHLGDILDIFGKTTKEPRAEVWRQPNSVLKVSRIEYTFPSVLVRIQFSASVSMQQLAHGPRKETHITVLDRDWAEGILNRTAKARRTCIRWMQEAMKPAAARDWGQASAPPLFLPEMTCLVEDDGIAYVDAARLKRLLSITKDEEQARKECRCCGYTTEFADRSADHVPVVACDFRKSDATSRTISLKPCRNLDEAAKGDTYVEALTNTPYLTDLIFELNSALMQEHFSPLSDNIRVIRDEENRYVPTTYEWRANDESTGRWLVRCFSDGRVVVIRNQSEGIR